MQVDVDAAELQKPTVRPDLPIHCDLKVFLREMLQQLAGSALRLRPSRGLAGVVPRAGGEISRRGSGEHRKPGPPLNPYYFIEQLFERLADDDVVVCGNAAACIVPYQAGRLKAGSAADLEFRVRLHGP